MGPRAHSRSGPSQCAFQAHVPRPSCHQAGIWHGKGAAGSGLGLAQRFPQTTICRAVKPHGPCHGAPTCWAAHTPRLPCHRWASLARAQGGGRPSDAFLQPEPPWPKGAGSEEAVPSSPANSPRPSRMLPHTAPRLPPLPASLPKPALSGNCPAHSWLRLPKLPQGVLMGPQEGLGLRTPNPCWACPFELNSVLSLLGGQAGLRASPSIPSELCPCQGQLPQARVLSGVLLLGPSPGPHPRLPS